MLEEGVEDIVRSALRDVMSAFYGKEEVSIDGASVLFGTGGLLDSLGLVQLILRIEEEIADRHGAQITIVSDRAMAGDGSPFRTLRSLTGFVAQLLQEKGISV